MAPLATLVSLLMFTTVIQGQLELGSRPPRIFKIGGSQIKNHHVLLAEGAHNQFKLECDVEDGAVPEPKVTWFKDGIEIGDDFQGISFPNVKEIEFFGKKVFF